MADQARAGAAHAGHGPVPATARLQARWSARSQMPQAGARTRSALAGGLRECLPGSEPTEVWMVRRRSTVRFRKGAPGHGRFSNMESGTSFG
jgi:hypothetical protein